MSRDISDSTSPTTLAKLKQERFVQKREAQIKELDHEYDKKIKILKKRGEDQLSDIRSNYRNKNFQENNEHLEVLDKVKKQNSKEIERLKIQKDQINNFNRAHINEINQNHSNKVRDLNEFQSEQITNLNNDFQLENQRMKYNLNSKKLQKNLEVESTIHESEIGHNRRLREREENLRNQLDTQKNRHETLITTLRRSNQKTVRDEKNRHSNLLKNIKKSNAQEAENQKKFYENLIRQQKEAFDSKFSALKKEQKLSLENMEKLTKSTINGYKSDSLQKIKVYETKQNDPFYQLKIIEPKIQETEKDYIISIPTSEYEVENINLNAKEKDIRISFSRRLKETITSEDGSINDATKSQNFSKRFKLDTVINDKSIKKTYDDGILQFRIAKK